MITKEKVTQFYQEISTLSNREKRDAIRLLCKKDLFFLSEYILRNRDSEKISLSESFHGEMADFLASDSQRKLLMAPRGHWKSTTANRNYVVWRLINNPNMTILVTSATLDNAKKKLRAIQDVWQKNEAFQWLFPELIPKNFYENWTQTQMLIPRKSSDAEMTVEVQGIESELTSRHYDMIIDDDVVGKENSSTKDQLEKVRNYYTQSLQLLKKPHGERLVIGTLWNYADLYNHILENLYVDYDIFIRSVWKEDRYERQTEGKDAGKYKWVTKLAPGQTDKTPLFPELFPIPAIESLRNEIVSDPLQGISTWMAQYELKIIDEKTAIFPRSKINDEGFWFEMEDLEDKKISLSLSCDPAVSESKHADETSFVVRGVDDAGIWYVIDCFGQAGMREEAVVDKYIEYLKGYPIDLATVETISFQRNLQYAIEKRCREERIHFPYLKLPSAYNAASKKESDMKIRGLAPLYATGKIRFLKNHKGVEALLDQLWRFPKASHDDRADSLAQHLHLPIIASSIWIKSDELLNKKPLTVDRYGYPIKQNNNNLKYV